ncbi:oxaloacetate decarboxylase [Clostridium sp. AF20-17LB]|nr:MULTISPECIES: oxaloacetate decarboxylase [unclassified Clostridium]RHR00062.1 oxaloacetate decarboxylase [Clostridium sp. AF20-17LB]RHU78991.1 oxaloacetate decarboxylase [Clostridiaceae bacterium OM08-6BH]RHV55829.1 oxaloacetate decarboxylase [Clostridium sp. OM04-12AA]
MKRILGICTCIVGILFVIVGIVLKMNNNAVSIIGGADGPTSVFVATKLSSGSVNLLIVIGIVLFAIAVICFLKRRH